MTQPPASRSEKESRTWQYLLALALLRIATSALISWSGIVALSDDDYARITIAQRAAQHLRFDPSGTSWLPFPFWVMGAFMQLLDPSLEVARLVTGALAVGATWLLFAAGRWWGLTPSRAFVAAALAAALPVSAVLGSVAVPEFPTAALVAFALIAITTPRVSATRSIFLACLALMAATLSRYETWPVAIVVAVLAGRRRDLSPWNRALAIGLAALGPLTWIVHNQIAHGHALSFFRRVATYRAALGPAGQGGETGSGYLRGLFSGSPAIMLALAVAMTSSLRAGDRAAAKRELERFLPWVFAAAALVACLALGELIGGAPTHHPERALLVVWLLSAVALVDLTTRRRISRWFALPVVLLLAFDYRRQFSSPGVNRQTEETIGVQLRSLVGPGERVFAATSDYGYFAIAAAFARPQDVAFDANDPRHPQTTTLLADPWNAPDRLEAERATWLVAPTSVVLPLRLRERSRRGALTIYELDARR